MSRTLYPEKRWLRPGTDPDEVIFEGDTRLADDRNPLPHNHAIADVEGLQAALDAKADDTDIPATPTIESVTGLQAALDSKADESPPFFADATCAAAFFTVEG